MKMRAELPYSNARINWVKPLSVKGIYDKNSYQILTVYIGIRFVKCWFRLNAGKRIMDNHVINQDSRRKYTRRMVR